MTEIRKKKKVKTLLTWLDCLPSAHLTWKICTKKKSKFLSFRAYTFTIIKTRLTRSSKPFIPVAEHAQWARDQYPSIISCLTIKMKIINDESQLSFRINLLKNQNRMQWTVKCVSFKWKQQKDKGGNILGLIWIDLLLGSLWQQNTWAVCDSYYLTSSY